MQVTDEPPSPAGPRGLAPEPVDESWRWGCLVVLVASLVICASVWYGLWLLAGAVVAVLRGD